MHTVPFVNVAYFVRAERANLHSSSSVLLRDDGGMLVAGDTIRDLETLLERQIMLGPRHAALEAFFHRFRLEDCKTLARRVDTYGLGITLFLLYVATRADDARRRGSHRAEAVRRMIASMCHPNPYERPEVGEPLLNLYDETLRRLLPRTKRRRRSSHYDDDDEVAMA